jgi:hypothetical protein
MLPEQWSPAGTVAKDNLEGSETPNIPAPKPLVLQTVPLVDLQYHRDELLNSTHYRPVERLYAI